MSVLKIRVTVVNHASVDIACPAKTLWTEILRAIAEGGAFADEGFQVISLDDPSAPLGCIRTMYESDAFHFDTIAQITERDEQAMRLGVRADFLSPSANGMISYATYHAVPTEQGSRYVMDAHSTLDHAIEEGASREDITRSVTGVRDQFDQGMVAGLIKTKDRIEQGHRPVD